MEPLAINNIETERTRLIKKRQQLVNAFNRAAETGKHKRLSELFIKIQQTNEFLQSLDAIGAAGTQRKGGPRRYAVSSLFLHESFRKLTADQERVIVEIDPSVAGQGAVVEVLFDEPRAPVWRDDQP